MIMRLISNLFFVLLLIVSFLHPSLLFAEQPIKLGVLAKRGATVAKKKWGPLAKYLTEKSGTEVRLIPLSFTGIEPAVKGKKIDYLLANPGFFVDLKKKYGIFALATMLNKRQDKALDRFGGVIFVRADSTINSVKDLKGKKFMCVKKTSFGGGQMAFRHMIERGINPFKDLKLLEGGKHDNVVYMVKKGRVDGGTVRSDTLERMEAEGKIKIKDFKVLDRVDDDFPFLHSTILYPEWPFAALKHVDSTQNQKIKEALLALKKDDPAAKAAKIAGWIEPLDYSPVATCLEIVREKASK